MAADSPAYLFTNNWFDSNQAVWKQLLQSINPTKLLEIGSYEGKSTTFLIDQLAITQDVEIHCVDSWQGGIEHQSGGNYQIDMPIVEERFNHNIMIAIQNKPYDAAIVIHKGLSTIELPKLIAEGKSGYFDFIYVDGSHQAPDVLLDAILSFALLRVNGVIAFDDYLWQEELENGTDPIRCPKIAIDAFANIYCRKIRVLRAPLKQLYVQKISN